MHCVKSDRLWTKKSFSFKISPVNVTKSAISAVTILDEILIKSKKSKQNGTAPEIFDICFGVIVDHYKVYF